MHPVKPFLTAITLAVTLSACTTAQTVPQAAAQTVRNTPTHTDIAYTAVGNKAQMLDIYLPEPNAPKAPTVIYVHGGGWLMGDKNLAGYDEYSQSHVLFKRLLDNGFAVVSLNYRLSGEAVYPAQEQDVAAAIRFIQQNAERYGLDGRRLALLGDSAGGQLIEITALKLGNRQIKAAVSFYGEADMQNIFADRSALKCPDVTAVMQQFVNYKLNGLPEEIVLGAKQGSASYRLVAQTASPVANVSRSAPPFLLLHGKPDCVVPAVQAERFKQKLDEHHIPNDLVLLDNAQHAAEFYTTPALQEKVLAFLKRHLLR